MRFHTTCRCLVWILRIAAEEHHASRFGFHRHHFSLLLVWRCLEDEFATVKILEQKLRWKMFLWKTLVIFWYVFFLRVEDGSSPHLFNKDRQQKGPGIIYQHIFVALVAKHMWNKKKKLVNYTYGPNATQTFLIKYNQISNHTKSTTPSCIEIHETSDSRKTYG